MASDFNYTQALEQAMSPINLMTAMNLRERARQEQLQDEARRRAQFLQDRESERTFQRDTTEDARLEAERATIKAQNIKVDEARSALYGATGYDDVDPREGNLEHDKKAIKRGTEKLSRLIQMESDAAAEVEKGLSVDDKDVGKRVMSRLLDDPDLIGVLKEGQIAGIRNGTISFAEVLKSLGKKDRGAVAGRYNQILTEEAERSQNEAVRKAAIRMREQQSRYNNLSNAIFLMQRALPPGAMADAFKDTPKPITTAKDRSLTDPIEAFTKSLVTGITGAIASTPEARPTSASVVPPPAAAPEFGYNMAKVGIPPTIARPPASVPLSPLSGGRWSPFAAAGRVPPPRGTELEAPGGMDTRVHQAEVGRASDRLFGTADKAYLARVKEWYKRKTGTNDAEIDGLIKAAYQGDPVAQTQIRRVMEQARAEVPQLSMPGPVRASPYMPMDMPMDVQLP